MADSEMARRAESISFREGGRAKWDYTTGLFTLSLMKLGGQTGDPRYQNYARDVIGSFIAPDGAIQTYRASDQSLDNINPGRTLLALYTATGETRFRQAADRLRAQLATQPRTDGGGFWHKKRYPDQMWLDGIYMAEPFYAQYARDFGQPGDFDDVARQILLIAAHTRDPRTGLFYHAWDAGGRQPWANPVTGCSSNFWGRAIGWYGMALVDTLDFFPASHPQRAAIVSTLKDWAAGVLKYQDPASGLWYQVVDQGGRQGNYLEATASAMFIYTLAKGVNRGYLPQEDGAAALKGWQGMISRLVARDADGKISLTRCCQVAGLGGRSSSGRARDGSFDYYRSEPIVTNDLKGVGPFILAGIEVQHLQAGSEDARIRQMALAQWSKGDAILARIQPPVFPAKRFLITDFGARSGGGADCTRAIAEAIDTCAEQGGGHVIVPAGEFLTGPIRLRSGVDLHLETNAVLLFTTNYDAYLPAVFTRFEGSECYNYSPFVYAFEQTNIALTGEGTLDGQAGDDNWWAWARRVRGAPPPASAARNRLVGMVAGNAPVASRRFGTGDYLRPNFIQPYRCRNVLIEGLHIRRSPMWEVNPTLCTNVIVRGLDIVSHGPNNDGCDPDTCRDVRIENCLFDTGDDCIAIKSGRNNDGRRIGLPSANLFVLRCTMRDGHAGVAIGSEISGGCSNVFVENCSMDSPHLERVLRLKSNAVRGGVLQNIFMRNVRVGQVASAVLQIDFLYEEGARGPYKPVARNVIMQNVTVRQTPRVFDVAAFPGSEISGVRVADCTFDQLQRADSIKGDVDVKMVHCTLERSR